MHQPPPVTTYPPVTDTDAARLCPACGYDLRGATGDRCSECGVIVDRATFAQSGLPWAYRHTRGRLSTFLATAWLVTLDAKSLRYEASRRQSPAEAVVFRRWVVTLVSACFAAVVILMYAGNAFDPMLAKKDGGLMSPGPTGWEADLHVPWSAGIGLPGAPFAYAVLAAAYVVGVPGAVFRTRNMPAERADAVRALGRYVAAPLVWLVPATALFVATFVATTREGSGFMRTPAFKVLIIACCLLTGLALAGTVHRTGQWRARSVHGGYATGFLAMGELLLRWCVGLGIVVFLVPWCAGLAWIIVDSFRG